MDRTTSAGDQMNHKQSIMESSLDGIVEGHKQNSYKEGGVVLTTLVSNGTVDIRGNVADKRFTGGWKASPFIIGSSF